MKIKRLPALTLREVQALGETLDGYDAYFKLAIKNKTCELYEINNGESFVISRLEHCMFKKDTTLVICCYKGKNLIEFVDHIIAMANRNNWLIRFHTLRPSLARWMHRKFNFNEKEYILTRCINHG